MGIRDEERRGMSLVEDWRDDHIKRLEQTNHQLMVQRDEARAKVRELEATIARIEGEANKGDY